MRWSSTEEKYLKKLYLNTSLTLNEIAQRLKRTPAAINHRLAKMGIKRRLSPVSKSPKKMTPALARLHAHICGDGYLSHYQEKDSYGYWAKYRRNTVRIRYVVGYENNNPDLLREFQRDMYESFGVRGKKIHKNKVRINSKRIWDFFRKLGVSDSHSWTIPDSIINGSKEIQKNWLRAFFDDEADFDDNGRIRVKIVNKKGLIQVMKMLKRFVPCHLTPKRGFYWGKTVCLNINKKDVPKFFSEIGSVRYPSHRKIRKSRNSPG
jgi:hypothetical protein